MVPGRLFSASSPRRSPTSADPSGHIEALKYRPQKGLPASCPRAPADRKTSRAGPAAPINLTSQRGFATPLPPPNKEIFIPASRGPARCRCIVLTSQCPKTALWPITMGPPKSSFARRREAAGPAADGESRPPARACRGNHPTAAGGASGPPAARLRLNSRQKQGKRRAAIICYLIVVLIRLVPASAGCGADRQGLSNAGRPGFHRAGCDGP